MEQHRGRILVGEWDPAARGALTAALAADGYEVCLAGEGREESSVVASASSTYRGDGVEPFDVIVWALEDEPPAETQRLGDPGAARALILLSGAGRLATAVEAERLGATAIMARPVDPAELCRVVESALAI
jgi:DNA-binding response OmpR family regulator